jgi:nanoRNase/pAp phosphatase (c-di-AMP/oligoRNAs hydrolase)
VIRKDTAERILREIKGAKEFAALLFSYGDSIASVLALNSVLKNGGKKTKIISFSAFNSGLVFCLELRKLKLKIFAKTDFSNFDLFIALDAAQEPRLPQHFSAGVS